MSRQDRQNVSRKDNADIVNSLLKGEENVNKFKEIKDSWHILTSAFKSYVHPTRAQYQG